MASLTQWTWVWVDSRHLWWTRRPGVLWSMGSQRVGHEIEQLNWPYCLRLRPPGYWLWWTSWHAIQHRWTCAAVWETMYCPRHHHRSKWTLDHPGKRRLESGDGGSNPPGDIFSICICTGPFHSRVKGWVGWGNQDKPQPKTSWVFTALTTNFWPTAPLPVLLHPRNTLQVGQEPPGPFLHTGFRYGLCQHCYFSNFPWGFPICAKSLPGFGSQQLCTFSVEWV